MDSPATIGDLRTREQVARRLLEETRGIPESESAVNVVSTLNVGELRDLCSLAIRFQSFLLWATIQAELQWEHPLAGAPRGYVEALQDIRALVLEGKLEEMLRDVGDTEAVERVEKLLGVEA